MAWLGLAAAAFGAGIVVAVVGGHATSLASADETSALKAQMTLQIRGGTQPLKDGIRGVLLEHDFKAWDLLLTGSKGRGQFTCELHSTDRDALFDIQRAILNAVDVSVSCVNGAPSSRGGVIIDLDDPKGGSFVLAVQRN